MTHFPRPRHLLKPSLYQRSKPKFLLVAYRKQPKIISKSMVQSLNHFARQERITWIFETLLDVMDLSHESFPLVVWIRSFAGTKDHFGTSYASRRVTWCTNHLKDLFQSVVWGPVVWILSGSPYERDCADSNPKPSGTQSTNLSVDSCRLYPGMQINLQQQQNCGR